MGSPSERAAEVETRVLLGHGERLPEPTRAAGPVPLAHRPAPGPDEVMAGHDLSGAHEHGRGRALLARRRG